MSWAGNISPFKLLNKSLFRKKEQALSPSDTGLSPRRLAEVEQAMQQWIENKAYRLPDRTLSEAALRIGCTSRELYRYCLTLGVDFRSWRSSLRIQDAREMLVAEPETSYATIARRVGFTDRSNFYHQFKAQTGMTPDEWRKNRP